MSAIKLYKKFYNVNILQSGGTYTQTYNLLNPYSLTANTYVAGTGPEESSVLIENNISITQESTGVYFANLNPILYSSDVTYDLVWFVYYLSTAPLKKISTRFRISTNVYTNKLEVEYLQSPLEIEISNNSLEIDI